MASKKRESSPPLSKEGESIERSPKKYNKSYKKIQYT